jgi:hypothetical protein
MTWSQLPSGPVKNVNVWILESPSVRRKDQLIINRQSDAYYLCFLIFKAL